MFRLPECVYYRPQYINCSFSTKLWKYFINHLRPFCKTCQWFMPKPFWNNRYDIWMFQLVFESLQKASVNALSLRFSKTKFEQVWKVSRTNLKVAKFKRLNRTSTNMSFDFKHKIRHGYLQRKQPNKMAIKRCLKNAQQRYEDEDDRSKTLTRTGWKKFIPRSPMNCLRCPGLCQHTAGYMNTHR